ncbi:translin-associated protein X [Topomyia yanbarensis]|uniref:translin-associated protein X n=1 Tax=Topomyia yanbarensis TaxID=2498891 RepID=UPI00273CBF42|nr:translin-associated protein X [Topomyia yanbarensis]
MSYHRGGNRRGNNFNKGGGNRYGGGGGKRGGGRDSDTPVDEKNPVIQSFREYARELDDKHDRYERIVKCSRDITIESKRIIFLLHTVDVKKNNQTQVCNEAKRRLEALCQSHFATIAKELHGLDPYQYTRAYTAGLQEFIEAYTFYEYVGAQNISHWKTIQEQLLTYKIAPDSAEGKKIVSDENDQPETEDEEDGDESPKKQVEISCLLSPMDFVLGIGDLSGEVMRKCVNSLGSGDVDSCFDHRRFMQELYKGFISVANARSRDFSQKLLTLRQSLLKSENVCYNVKVRGGEAAKWGNTDDCAFVPKDNLDEDEGIFF